jgi:hypothetical protein
MQRSIAKAKTMLMAWQPYGAELQVLVALMGWPFLYYLKEGQDLLQWPLLLQYALLVYLFLLARRRDGWSSLKSGDLKPVWILAWSLLCYLTVITLTRSPIFLNGVIGYIKHVQFLPMLLVCAAIAPRPRLLRHWLVPYLLVLLFVLAVPLVVDTVSDPRIPRAVLYSGPGLNPQRPGGYVRYSFIFGNANSLGLFAGCVVVFCLFSSLSRFRRARVGVPVLGVLILGAYLVYASLSRRAWVAFPIVVLLGISLQRGLKRRLWLMLGAAFLLLAIGLLYGDPIIERLSGALRLSEAGTVQGGSLGQRLFQMDLVAQYLERPSQWLFGLGAGTIGFAVRNYLSAGYASVDGYYGVVLGEFGLVGLALYLALSVAALIVLFRSILRRELTPQREEIAIASLASATLLLIAGLAGNSNTAFPHGLYLWSFLGLGLGACAAPEGASE